MYTIFFYSLMNNELPVVSSLVSDFILRFPPRVCELISVSFLFLDCPSLLRIEIPYLASLVPLANAAADGNVWPNKYILFVRQSSLLSSVVNLQPFFFFCRGSRKLKAKPFNRPQGQLMLWLLTRHRGGKPHEMTLQKLNIPYILTDMSRIKCSLEQARGTA